MARPRRGAPGSAHKPNKISRKYRPIDCEPERTRAGRASSVNSCEQDSRHPAATRLNASDRVPLTSSSEAASSGHRR